MWEVGSMKLLSDYTKHTECLSDCAKNEKIGCVKREGTGERPSALSKWYRETLGPKVAITNIDWVITSIDNKDSRSRYLIIEEKNISSFDHLHIGLGEARSLKEVRNDIARESVPILVVFVKGGDPSQGVCVYEFDPKHVEERGRWVELAGAWYVNVKDVSNFVPEKEFTELIKGTINGRRVISSEGRVARE